MIYPENTGSIFVTSFSIHLQEYTVSQITIMTLDIYILAQGFSTRTAAIFVLSAVMCKAVPRAQNMYVTCHPLRYVNIYVPQQDAWPARAVLVLRITSWIFVSTFNLLHLSCKTVRPPPYIAFCLHYLQT